MRISDWSSDVCSSDLNIDVFLFFTLGLGHQRALGALCGNLQLHGSQDFIRRGQVTDLVTQYLHAPVGDRTSVVEGKSVSVSVDLGGRRIFHKKNNPDIFL